MMENHRFECTSCGERYDYGETVRIEEEVMGEWGWLGRLLFGEKEFTLPTAVTDPCPECGNDEYEEKAIYG